MLDYDRMAADYAKHRGIHPGVLHDLLTTGHIEAATRILEVGCGTGNYIAALHSAAGCPCYGVDPSEEMLSHARERSDGIDWSVGRGEDLRHEPGAFDLVFSVDVIHHVSDRAAFLHEVYRVLRSGGRACTVTDSEWIIRNRLTSHYFPETVPAELERYPTMDQLRRLMEGAGFDCISEHAVEHGFELSDIQAYRDKACSCLHLIPRPAFERGIERLERDIAGGPVHAVSRYVLLWGAR